MEGRVSSEANKALMRRFYEKFWCKGNADAVFGFDAPRVAQAPRGPRLGICIRGS